MNWDQIQGKWKQFAGSARERWGKLTDDNRDRVAGKKDQLVGRIQERHGLVRADAEKRADDRALAQKGSERERHSAPSPLEITPPWTHLSRIPWRHTSPLTWPQARVWRMPTIRPEWLALVSTLISALGLPLCADVCNPNDLQGSYGFQLSGETATSGDSKPVANLGRIVLARDGGISGYSTVMFAGFLLTLFGPTLAGS